MQRLTFSLDAPFRWRVPWEVAAVELINTDGDPSSLYVQLGRHPGHRWVLSEVRRVSGPPSLEWHIGNLVAQPGAMMEVMVLNPAEVNAIPVMEVRGVKAHSIRSGAITVGTSPVQGPEIRAAPDRAVLLQVDSGNSGTIYVGESSSVSTSTGFPLGPGTILELNVDSLSDLWFVADSNGNVIRYIVEVIV